MRTVRIKINAQCVLTIQLCTRFLILLESIELIDMCTRMGRTIYSSNEHSSKLVNNPVITCYSNI